MKKSLLFLSLIPTLIMTSCGSNKLDTSKIALDSGDIHSKNVTLDDFEELTYDKLDSLITDKSSFVLVTFNDRNCGCWRDFFPLFVKFSNEYHYSVKLFDVALLEGKSNKFDIYSATSQMPGICFFRRGKLIRQSVYGKNAENNRKMFKQYDKFEEFMLENVYLPKLYYLDKDVLESKIASNEEFNLYVAKTTCHDCGRIEKDFIHGWVDNNKANTLNDLLYVFDIYPWNGTAEYQGIKDMVKLSFEDLETHEIYNEKFGYGTGYVPTFQRWKNGEVVDMITVLNDSVDTNLKVTSYFNEHRISNSPLLKDTGTKYLFDGKTVTESDIQEVEYGGVVYKFLSQDTQFNWHKPVVELFFNEYVK